MSPTHFVYPDLMVIRGKPELMGKGDAILNPKVIVEILAPTTEDYQLLPSFEEYVFIAQDEPRVSVYHKAPGDLWRLATYRGLESAAKLTKLGIDLPLSEIYDGVAWSQPPPSVE